MKTSSYMMTKLDTLYDNQCHERFMVTVVSFSGAALSTTPVKIILKLVQV